MGKYGFDVPDEIQDFIGGLSDILIDGFNCKGGNSYVFLGEHKIMKQRVALKFYYYVDDSHSEVEILATLNHRNIINILDARSVGNGWAYFMTLEIKNGDLDNLIENKIGIRRSFTLIRGILDGLSVLHNPPYRLVHRDLKPSNIFIDSNENPLIGDFGSIKKIEDNESTTNASRHTLLYKPFEAFENIHMFSSDIYQVGIILFQLLGGRFPYSIDEWLSKSEKKALQCITDLFERSIYEDECIKKRVKANRLIDVESLPLYTTEGMKKIIKKATIANHSVRYQTAAEFMLAIHKYGKLPDWKEIDGVNYLYNWNGRDYRIVKRGRGFICEFKTCAATSWRKKSDISSGEIEDVIKELNSKCGIA
ncbi:protein kinase domain-containing protein [Anoxynatronum buryatiense]|uniref:Serine/threonine protein kinase n=1 Tax=Anoxynatronum buryatiense TaxID=489973 RepID=A0AA45WZN7_9CLOT|nr:protein kinase [Anoxynatronum buryatiense]SMP72272.1 Serine/threonine protein kinase [Anoxynatronum buryatiense]